MTSPNAEKKEKEESSSELREVHVKLLGAQEEERKRLATELHDHFAQELIALQMMLSGASLDKRMPEDLKASLQRASDRCSDLVGHIRRISHGLYPPMLKNMGLYRALQSFARISDTVRINVQVDWDCGPVTTRFSPELEISLFRIAQESVTNAMRHANPRNIRLSVSKKDDCINIKIKDDGCGFCPDSVVGKGLGLQTMKERIIAVSGWLNIESGAEGTVVEAQAPAH